MRRVYAGDGDDVVRGAQLAYGSSGDDRIVGTRSLTYGDELHGGSGKDVLRGLDGTDHLFGDDNADFLDGGPGSDIGHGGDGTDTCVAIEGRIFCELPSQVADPVEGTGRVWASTSAGSSHTCGVRVEGSLWCWGYNEFGQLGIGDDRGPGHTAPIRVGTDHDWVKVSAAGHHTCAVRTDGSLWCWGSNGGGELGVGDTIWRFVPTRVGAENDWVDVFSGPGYTCGLRSVRVLWCWGYNGDGRLGLGDTETRLIPTQVDTDHDWVGLSVGGNTCGVDADRSLWCWGSNEFGQLGVGDTTDRLVPTRVGTENDWDKIFAGEATCGVRTDRSLWCWGHNNSGHLGLGDEVDRLVPSQVGTDGTGTTSPPPGRTTRVGRVPTSRCGAGAETATGNLGWVTRSIGWSQQGLARTRTGTR